MKQVLTLGGSNSVNSISKQLAEFSGSKLSEINVVNIDLNDYELPLFSVDLEAKKGYPENALALHEVFQRSDGFIIALAEHNGAYSAVFKNMFDWLSRIEASFFYNKPLLLLSTSPGARGGQSVLEIALSRFPRHGAEIIGSLSIPSFEDNFKDGQLVDPELLETLEGMIKDFQNKIIDG